MGPVDLRSDGELLVAARLDPQAFAVFYRRHARGLLGFFRRRVDNADAAFDLVAQTMAAALAGVSRYELRGEPASGWLYGIARNKLAEAHRSGRIDDRARRALAMAPIVVDDEGIERLEGDAGTPALDLLAALPQDQLSMASGMRSGRVIWMSASTPRSLRSCGCRSVSCASASAAA